MKILVLAYLFVTLISNLSSFVSKDHSATPWSAAIAAIIVFGGGALSVFYVWST